MGWKELVDSMGLLPHPEGGYYREIWRSPGLVPGKRPGTIRNAATSILFLIPGDGCSRLHRLASDETWVHRAGGELELVELALGAPALRTVIGSAGPTGFPHSHTIPAGTWFGARPVAGSGFALVECTVAPGFDFADFELGKSETLLEEYPGARGEIQELS